MTELVKLNFKLNEIQYNCPLERRASVFVSPKERKHPVVC